ncbi:MAG: hypothetical protein UY82_C0004G0011 [Candidatus Uhrbacteria bacterium GW2011_GWC2_53_7]|uniref:Uncharacterized protein n=1 Tax=Candidatus Uhrbacteria bacterium GW2011_GWC2_53_7 TaxID=1618986 RepID=A0A0G1Y1A8_9BACT|nr:MAG: hypothetical protein UY82_C0004G0011 [Candidatus Uhrbacteria bacterium GW2011_GWC2_53_7]
MGRDSLIHHPDRLPSEAIGVKEDPSLLSVDQIEAMDVGDLARLGGIENVSEEIKDRLSDRAFDKLTLALGERQHEKDNEVFEVPEGEPDFYFCTDKVSIFSTNPNMVTFFVMERFPKVEQEAEPSTSKITIVFTPYVPCVHGTCGVSVLRQFKEAQSPDVRFDNCGIGSIVKKGDEVDIRWGSGAGTQNPNREDLDYFGVYPQKFADWIKEHIRRNMGEIIGK